MKNAAQLIIFALMVSILGFPPSFFRIFWSYPPWRTEPQRRRGGGGVRGLGYYYQRFATGSAHPQTKKTAGKPSGLLSLENCRHGLGVGTGPVHVPAWTDLVPNGLGEPWFSGHQRFFYGLLSFLLVFNRNLLWFGWCTKI
jgi:hypothetical protein